MIIDTSASTNEKEEFLQQIENFVDTAWTKQESGQTFQTYDSNSTPSHINDLILTKNPLGEIEKSLEYLLKIDSEEFPADNNFESLLFNIINRYGDLAIFSLMVFLDKDKVSSLQAVKILSLIGKVTNQKTYNSRLWLLVQNLFSKSKFVRDGASLGLLNLGDPSAISFINKAIESEPSKLLKSNMQKVRDSLGKK